MLKCFTADGKKIGTWKFVDAGTRESLIEARALTKHTVV